MSVGIKEQKRVDIIGSYILYSMVRLMPNQNESVTQYGDVVQKDYFLVDALLHGFLMWDCVPI